MLAQDALDDDARLGARVRYPWLHAPAGTGQGGQTVINAAGVIGQHPAGVAITNSALLRTP
jgi:hypothetical protein